MKPWTQRPIEEANLLNPAFCCVTLTSSIIGYSDTGQNGLPLPLAFTILPIVLHKKTREALPKTIRTPLAAWIQDNASLRVFFPERSRILKPYAQEAILFGLQNKWLELAPEAKLNTPFGESFMRKILGELNGEAREAVLRARFLGRWFSASGTVQTVMALWGIRP